MCLKHILDKSTRLITIPIKTINCDNMSLKFQKFVLILPEEPFLTKGLQKNYLETLAVSLRTGLREKHRAGC